MPGCIPRPDGSIARVDVSTRRDGKVDRTEYYENDALVRAEEDSDEDGKADKWETYEAGRLASVAFDTLHRGTPDRRLIYGVDGSTRLEVDASRQRSVRRVDTPPRRAAAPRMLGSVPVPLRIAFDLDGVLADMESELVRQAEILFGDAMTPPAGTRRGSDHDRRGRG